MSLLDGLRVVDLSEGIAGGYATKLLADAGADVVKVEDPSGDPLRTWSACGGPADPYRGGVLFQYLHTSKRSMAGRVGDAAVADLVATADVVVESGQLGPADLAAWASAHPRLGVVSITPFGRQGPWADRPATEFTLQALCGSTAARGVPEREPIYANGRLGEWFAGAYGAFLALVCARSARTAERGEHADLSMFEAMCLGLTSFPQLRASMGVTLRAGEVARSLELPSVEPTADGHVGFCTITGLQFQSFLALIGRADLIDDADLASFAGRERRRAEFLEMVHAWTTARTTEEVLAEAALLRIPVAPVGTPATVATMDHFAQREVFVPHPSGSFTQPRPPWQVEGVAPRPFEPLSPPWPAGPLSWAGPPATPGAAGRPGAPLAGVRVIDLTAFWAGPAATQLLAALGADVIKVESIQRPDGARFITTRSPADESWWEWSATFQVVNANKRGVTLDLTSEAGCELLFDLVARADVLIDNFSPRVLDNFGITWERVHAANPRLVMLRMPAFGLSGPWRDRPGFAQTMEQITGMAWLTGYADGPPVIPRGICDPLAGVHAAFTLLAALEERHRHGVGRLVESTMVEAALNVAAELVVESSAHGCELGRDGDRGPVAAPQGVYRCAGDDEWVAIAVTDDAQWAALVAEVGSGDHDGDDAPWGLATLVRGPGAEARRRAHDDIDRALGAWTAGQGAAEVAERLVQVGVPAARVVPPADQLDNPQVRDRGFVEIVDHPVIGRHEAPGLPFRLATHPGPWVVRGAPRLGADSRDVLAELAGVDAARFAELEEAGVVGDRPIGA